jgi:hypothetical protein
MSDTDKRYEPIRGNPARSTKGGSSPSDTDESSDADSSSGSPRTRRVSVTPRDWDQVEALADDLGLPYSKLYNLAFSALLEKLDRNHKTNE